MSTREIIDFILHETGTNANQFATSIGITSAQVYDIRGGKIKRISEKIADKILAVYPDFNRVFLLTGEGEPYHNRRTDLDEHCDITEMEEDDEIITFSREMKIAPLVPVDITSRNDVRIWDYVNQHKRMLDRIPSQLMPHFDMMHIVRSNILQPAIDKGDVLFLKHLEHSIDSIINGHIYYISTKRNSAVIKKIFVNEGKLECHSLMSDKPVKLFDLDDIYDIFSIVVMLKFSIPQTTDQTNALIKQNSALIEELSAQRKIIEKLIH